MNADGVLIVETACPHCGHKFDRTSYVGDENIRPSPGDVSLCIKCVGISLFTNSAGDMRKATRAEIREMMSAPEWAEIQKAQLAIAHVNRGRGH